MTLVIGVHGAKGSGKDQFFKAAKAAFPDIDIRKVAYADPIKYEVSNIFGIEGEQQYDQFKRTDLSFTVDDGQSYQHVAGRRVVREIGMLMRRYDPHQFVRYVEQYIQTAPQAVWCVTDVRFENELYSIKNNLRGIIVKINRAGYHFDGHATETEIADGQCDLIINNDNLTLDQYNDLVAREFAKILQQFGIVKESK
jgi:hypothetical protein